MDTTHYRLLTNATDAVAFGCIAGELIWTGLLYTLGSLNAKDTYSLTGLFGDLTRNPRKDEARFFHYTSIPARWLLKHF